MDKREAKSFIDSLPDGEHVHVITKESHKAARRITGERNRRFTISCTESQFSALEESWQSLIEMSNGQKTKAADALILLINEYICEEFAK